MWFAASATSSAAPCSTAAYCPTSSDCSTRTTAGRGAAAGCSSTSRATSSTTRLRSFRQAIRPPGTWRSRSFEIRPVARSPTWSRTWSWAASAMPLRCRCARPHRFRRNGATPSMPTRNDRRGAARLPRRPVIITFDDGYRSNRDVALPLLQQHGFRATIFLVAERVGGTNAWDPDEIQEPLLDAAAVRAMQARGIEFGSHSATHARLTALDRAAVLKELRDSRALLGTLLGRPVQVLAYPYGAHNAPSRHLAAEAGYEAAVAIRRRMNGDDTDLFALRRIPVTSETSVARFAWDLFRLSWFYGT